MQRMDTQSNGEAHILALPPELLEIIAGYTHVSDLLALRQTCRDFAGASLRAYIEAHFVTKTFTLSSRASMEHLLALSQHPVYCKSVMKLHLSTRALISAECDLHARRRLFSKDRRTLSRAQRAAIRDERQTHQGLSDDFSLYASSGTDVCVLTEVLRNFANAGNAISLHVSDLNWSKPHMQRPIGHGDLARKLGHNKCFRFFGSIDWYSKALRAIFDAEVKLRSLIMGEYVSGVPLSIFHIRCGDVSAAIQFFSRLRKLDLTLNAPERDSEEAMSGVLSNAAISLSILLRWAEKIDRLILRFVDEGFCRSDIRLFSLIAEQHTFPALYELHLTGHVVEPEALMSFIDRHSHTLRSLHLQNVQAEPRVACPDFGDRLRRDILHADAAINMLHVYTV